MKISEGIHDEGAIKSGSSGFFRYELWSLQVHHGAFHGHRDEKQRAADADRRVDGRDHQQRRPERQERGDRLRVDHSLDQPQPERASSAHRQAAALHQTRSAEHSVFRRNRQGRPGVSNRLLKSIQFKSIYLSQRNTLKYTIIMTTYKKLLYGVTGSTQELMFRLYGLPM